MQRKRAHVSAGSVSQFFHVLTLCFARRRASHIADTTAFEEVSPIV